jgi:hypothetical protein
MHRRLKMGSYFCANPEVVGKKSFHHRVCRCVFASVCSVIGDKIIHLGGVIGRRGMTLQLPAYSLAKEIIYLNAYINTMIVGRGH